MATSLKTLIPLLSSIVFLLSAAAAAPPPKTTSFSYDFNGGKPSGLTYQGDAHFPPETTHLRLTKTDTAGNATALSVGRALHTNPIKFCGGSGAKVSFDTTLKFIIKPNPGGKIDPADGLVFFITAVDSAAGSPGGSFGVFDESGQNPAVFAVEFDVYVNTFDPRYRHVGIDIQSQVSSNATAVDDGIVGREATARIRYDAATDLISVRGRAGGKGFEVSYVYELCKILPREVRVGVAAATGNDVAVHDVISWSFSSTLVGKKHI